MIIRITSKLAAKVKIKPTESLPQPENPFGDWSANLFIADRKQYILLANTVSLFSMVFSARGITSKTALATAVLKEIRAALLAADHSEIAEMLPQDPREVSTSKTLNASVTQSVNDLIRHARYVINDFGLQPAILHERLNRLPMGRLKMNTPAKTLDALCQPDVDISELIKKPKKRGGNYVDKTAFTRILRFNVSLPTSYGNVWRRIELADTRTFWDLHCLITDSFGWLDYHLHQFSFGERGSAGEVLLGVPFEDDVPAFLSDPLPPTLPDWETDLVDHFTAAGEQCSYEYDFGDGWEHLVTFEGTFERKEEIDYPRCIGGSLACPPEDCGGTPGYKHFLDAISDEQHPEHDMMRDWVGGRFDPDQFELSKIKISDPALRFRIAFEDARVPKNLRMRQYHAL